MKKLPDLPHHEVAGLKITEADEFSYHDPVDGSVSEHQGVRLRFEGGGRAVLRLSGTGTQGATLRVYLERFEPPDGDLTIETQEALSAIIEAVSTLTELERHTGRKSPDVIT